MFISFQKWRSTHKSLHFTPPVLVPGCGHIDHWNPSACYPACEPFASSVSELWSSKHLTSARFAVHSCSAVQKTACIQQSDFLKKYTLFFTFFKFSFLVCRWPFKKGSSCSYCQATYTVLCLPNGPLLPWAVTLLLDGAPRMKHPWNSSPTLPKSYWRCFSIENGWLSLAMLVSGGCTFLLSCKEKDKCWHLVQRTSTIDIHKVTIDIFIDELCRLWQQG